jgi:saccharopine dehydrogenase-like NADP-dependent oxidoreductase
LKLLVLGGAGAMASGTVRDLLAPGSLPLTEIVVADKSQQGAQALVQSLRDPRARPVAFDVGDRAGLMALISACDLCINAVPTFAGHQMEIFEACLEARRTYVDYGGMGVFTVKQKQAHDAWRQAGVTAVLGLGADPGVSNMLCKAVAERLDCINRINLYWAATLCGSENPVLAPPYNLMTLLGEYANSSMQFLDGALREVPPRSGQEVLLLPQPWGRTEFMYTQHSEPLTVPFAGGIKEKGIRELTWKLHLPRHEHAAWSALMKVGFEDYSEPVRINGIDVVPSEFLEVLIRRNVERNRSRIPQQESYELHLAIGHGTAAGRTVTVNCAVLGRPHPAYVGYVDPATSMGLSIGVQLLLSKPLKPGVWGPEEYFEVAPFFAEISRRHFEVVTDLPVQALG